MIPQTYIFIGRSGCGKGTQAALLQKILETDHGDMPIVHVETGKIFREFIKGTTYTHEIAKKIYNEGGLQPEFLAVNLWSNFFIENMVDNCNLIIDGTPRKFEEAYILDSTFRFYSRHKPHIIFVNVSRKWSEERMTERKRKDDTKHDIKARLDWFETEVMRVVDYYKSNPDYAFHDVNGERAIEEIHDDIVKMTGLSK